MARPLIEEGEGAPSFRPLWRLLPYLWPKGQPGLRARVFASLAFLAMAMVIAYVWFTFAITRWRIQFRRDMNESDQDANTKAVDSLLNYETVKYFNNEAHETRRFDKSMGKYSRASIQAQISLSV